MQIAVHSAWSSASTTPDQHRSQRPILLAVDQSPLAGTGRGPPCIRSEAHRPHLQIHYDRVNVNVHLVSEKQLRSSEPLAPT